MFLLLFSCAPLELTLYGQTHTGSSTISWESISLRPEKVPWAEEWTFLSDFTLEQTITTTPSMIAQEIIPSDRYIHIFTDALSAYEGEEALADIIEPIACPLQPFGSQNVTITYITIEQQIFAMDCIVE